MPFLELRGAALVVGEPDLQVVNARSMLDEGSTDVVTRW
jgi:hypothetical protein